jgi:hypothetical protein
VTVKRRKSVPDPPSPRWPKAEDELVEMRDDDLVDLLEQSYADIPRNWGRVDARVLELTRRFRELAGLAPVDPGALGAEHRAALKRLLRRLRATAAAAPAPSPAAAAAPPLPAPATGLRGPSATPRARASTPRGPRP